MYDIFISHSSKDKVNIVSDFTDKLKNYGLDVWVDEEGILCGDNILHKIQDGVEKSLCTLLILTPSFFHSSWIPLELGMALAKSKYSHIIPILIGVSLQTVAENFPFILSLKYILVESNNIDDYINKISQSVYEVKKQIELEQPLSYKAAVKKLNGFDMPSTNKLSILISDYEQISKINVITGTYHATQIAKTIVDDIYARIKFQNNYVDLTYLDKLEILIKSNTGLNLNIYEHLKLLISAALTDKCNALFTDSDMKKMTDLSIASILNWYMSYLLSMEIMPKDVIEIVWPEELNYQDFVDMYEIDKQVLRSDLIAKPDISYRWYQYNNYTHIAVRSSQSKKIVGYFALLPITDDLFNEIKLGNFKDNDLSIENIRQYDIPDFYKLYVACVCIHPKFQNTSAFSKLYNALVKMMYSLASDREIYITEIITEASTFQGVKLCKILGLSKLTDTNLNTEIYTAMLLPPSLRLRSNFGGKLIRFYQDKYQELRELF